MESLSFKDLNNKVCAITGGGGVIGKSLALGLASVGVKVAILDLNKEVADSAAAEITKETGSVAIGVEANVLEKESLIEAKKVINNKLGKIELLINCAGGNSPKATTHDEFMEPSNKDNTAGNFFGLDIEGFRRVFDLNFLGTLLPTMILSTDMVDQEKGSILNISSMNAFKPLTKIPAYSAAKASINNFTEWLATHFAKLDIRVNAVAPGFFLTNQNRFLLVDEQTGEPTARGKKIMDGTPMGKYGEPDDLQGASLYLLSDLSKFVTGIVIPVDGGFNAYSGV
ncbi:MAG: SDR family oxidoreductase [Melioribacteraceae bacterium]|nr:SDR family oxidoreductase [Melioribacteraceae bacterium]